MSLPSSFTIRPGSKPTNNSKNEDNKTVAEMESTSVRAIQFSFSGQEVHGQQELTHPIPRTHIDTRSKGTKHHPNIDPPFPPIEDQYSRRSIRVSPFEPMAHLRRMPRNGTISPLRIHEYQVEMEATIAATANEQHRHVILHETSPSFSSTASHNSRPPLEEVRIPVGPSLEGTHSSSASSASSSVDYKALYKQSQREIEALQKEYRALQKLQERTLGENHLWQSRLKTYVKRHFANQQHLAGTPQYPNRRSPSLVQSPIVHSKNRTTRWHRVNYQSSTPRAGVTVSSQHEGPRPGENIAGQQRTGAVEK